MLDDFGNKTSEFDGTSIESWTYDSFRRPLTHTNAASGVTTYDYGLNGSSCTCYVLRADLMSYEIPELAA